MNTNKNFETVSSENLMKTAGGIHMFPSYENKQIQKLMEEEERREQERKKAEKMVSTGIHGDPMFLREH